MPSTFTSLADIVFRSGDTVRIALAHAPEQPFSYAPRGRRRDWIEFQTPYGETIEIYKNVTLVEEIDWVIDECKKVTLGLPKHLILGWHDYLTLCVTTYEAMRPKKHRGISIVALPGTEHHIEAVPSQFHIGKCTRGPYRTR